MSRHGFLTQTVECRALAPSYLPGNGHMVDMDVRESSAQLEQEPRDVRATVRFIATGCVVMRCSEWWVMSSG